MKPDKTYLSLRKGSDRVIKLLFVLFIAQVLLLSLCRISIPIPVGLAQKLSERQQTNGISFDFEQVMFSFPNKISARKFVIRKNGLKSAVINEIEIQYPLLKSAWGKWGDLNGLRAKKIALHSEGEVDSCLQVEGLDVHRKRNGEYILNASIHCEHSSLKAKGTLNFDYLKSIFESLPKKKSRFELSEVMDRALDSVEKLRAILRQTGAFT